MAPVDERQKRERVRGACWGVDSYIIYIVGFGVEDFLPQARPLVRSIGRARAEDPVGGFRFGVTLWPCNGMWRWESVFCMDALQEKSCKKIWIKPSNSSRHYPSSSRSGPVLFWAVNKHQIGNDSRMFLVYQDMCWAELVEEQAPLVLLELLLESAWLHKES